MKKGTVLVIAVCAVLTCGVLIFDCVYDDTASHKKGHEKRMAAMESNTGHAVNEIENDQAKMLGQIEANEEMIMLYKERTQLENKEVKDLYEKQITDLEQRNNEMRKKLIEYKHESTGKEKWLQFKADFKHSMQVIGNGFKKFIFKTVKKPDQNKP